MTKDKGISYEDNLNILQPSAYTDADWASGKHNRRLTWEVFVMSNGAPVIFNSKMQQSVQRKQNVSIILYVYMKCYELTSLQNEMQVQINYAIPIHKDNQRAIAIAKNDGYQRRAKHIDLKYYFVRDQVKDKIIELKSTETKSHTDFDEEIQFTVG